MAAMWRAHLLTQLRKLTPMASKIDAQHDAFGFFDDGSINYLILKCYLVPR